MKKTVSVLLLTFGLLVVNAADFRNVNFGASRATVKKAEVAKIEEENNTELVFKTTIASQPTFVRYYFSADKLIRAEYNFLKQYRESEKYVEAYDSLQSQLEQKYGAPLSKLQHCDDPFYVNVPRRWGTGIVVGKLSRESSWRVGQHLVCHTIRALPGGTVSHSVFYEPVKKNSNEFSASEIISAL